MLGEPAKQAWVYGGKFKIVVKDKLCGYHAEQIVTASGARRQTGAAWYTMLMRMPWKTLADEQTRFCLRTFWDADAQLFRPSAPMKPDLPSWDFISGNGVAFSMLLGAAQSDPARYRRFLPRLFEGIETYWQGYDLVDTVDPGAEDHSTQQIYEEYRRNFGGPGYGYLLLNQHDRSYGDNARIVIIFAEAFALTRDWLHLARAEATLAFVLSGWDTRRGVSTRSKRKGSKPPTRTLPVRLPCY